jgi:hypothetical protein
MRQHKEVAQYMALAVKVKLGGEGGWSTVLLNGKQLHVKVGVRVRV